MTESLAALVPEYGLALVLLATFLSCLALPVPSSLIMLSAGAFAASGDLSLAATAGSALAGAVAGDQAGYALGRGGAPMLDRLRGRRARLLSQARGLVARHVGKGVFLSRWLFSPLGPYVNYIAGATRVGWPAFTLWAAAGEVVWVTLYVGAGFAFSGQIEAVAVILGNASGALAAAAVTTGLGYWLWRLARRGARG